MIWSEQFAPQSLMRTNFPYFHVVFTLPNPTFLRPPKRASRRRVADIAYQTKAVVYARLGSVFAYSGGGWSAR